MFKVASFLLMCVLISLSAGIVLSQAWQGVVGGSAKLMESSVKSAAKDSMGKKLVIMNAPQADNKSDSIIVNSNAQSTTITFTSGVQTPYLFTDTVSRTWYVDPVRKTASLAYIKANSKEDLQNIQLDSGEHLRLYKINSNNYYLAFDSKNTQKESCGRIYALSSDVQGQKGELEGFMNFYNRASDLTVAEKELLQLIENTGLIIKNTDTGKYSLENMYVNIIMIPESNSDLPTDRLRIQLVPLDELVVKFNSIPESQLEQYDKNTAEQLLQLGVLNRNVQNNAYIVTEKGASASVECPVAYKTDWESYKNDLVIPHELAHLAFSGDLEYMNNLNDLFHGMTETQRMAIGYFLVVTGKASYGYAINNITGELRFDSTVGIGDEWSAYFGSQYYIENEFKVDLSSVLSGAFGQKASESAINRLKQYINDGVFSDDFILEWQPKLAEIRGSAISRLFAE